MQNVATSIFYAGLFAGIYDAAIGILLLLLYPPTAFCFFLCVLPQSTPLSPSAQSHPFLYFIVLSLFLPLFFLFFRSFHRFARFSHFFLCVLVSFFPVLYFEHQKSTSFFLRDKYRHFLSMLIFFNHYYDYSKWFYILIAFYIYIYNIYKIKFY